MLAYRQQIREDALETCHCDRFLTYHVEIEVIKVNQSFSQTVYLEAGEEIEKVFLNENEIIKVAQAMVLEFECNDELVVRLNGENITSQLGLESTGNLASQIAALPDVRRVLLQKQQDFKQPPGLVADGRDMGTVIFPGAENKVFLTASAAKRAERRYKQLIEKGIDANLVDITNEIEERDRRDMERKAAPLVIASDALYIDSSDMTIDAVVEEVLNLIR